MKRFRAAMILMPLFFISFSLVGYGRGGEDTEKLEEHSHTLEHTQRVDSTCEDEENTEYWYCDNCGKYFSDERGTIEILEESTVVAPKGHTLDHVDAVDSSSVYKK